MISVLEPPSQDVPPVFFDSERLSIVADNDMEKTAILTLFFHEANRCIRQMQYALQHPDARVFKESAHGLQGSAANMGMHNLAELCKKAEQKEHAVLTEQKEALAAICTEIQELKDYMIKSKLLAEYV